MLCVSVEQTVALSQKNPTGLSCRGIFHWRCILASGRGVQFGYGSHTQTWLFGRHRD